MTRIFFLDHQHHTESPDIKTRNWDVICIEHIKRIAPEILPSSIKIQTSVNNREQIIKGWSYSFLDIEDGLIYTMNEKKEKQPLNERDYKKLKDLNDHPIEEIELTPWAEWHICLTSSHEFSSGNILTHLSELEEKKYSLPYLNLHRQQSIKHKLHSGQTQVMSKINEVQQRTSASAWEFNNKESFYREKTSPKKTLQSHITDQAHRAKKFIISWGICYFLNIELLFFILLAVLIIAKVLWHTSIRKSCLAAFTNQYKTRSTSYTDWGADQHRRQKKSMHIHEHLGSEKVGKLHMQK